MHIHTYICTAIYCISLSVKQKDQAYFENLILCSFKFRGKNKNPITLLNSTEFQEQRFHCYDTPTVMPECALYH